MFDNLFDWIDSSLGAWAKKVLSSLGIGWLSFEGITELASQLKDQFLASWGGIPQDVVNILSMAGFGVAFGVVFGAITYRAVMSAFGRLGKVIVG